MKLVGLFVYFLVLLILVVLGVLFAKDNSYFVTLSFMGKGFTPIPLWILVFSSFFIGVVISALFFSWEVIKLSVMKKKLLKKLDEHISKNVSDDIDETSTKGNNS